VEDHHFKLKSKCPVSFSLGHDASAKPQALNPSQHDGYAPEKSHGTIPGEALVEIYFEGMPISALSLFVVNPQRRLGIFN
jgi:hypothetical protein